MTTNHDTTTPECPHCPDGHADPTSRPWGVFVSKERDGDGEPTHLCVMPTAGQHVAESDAEWARRMLNRPDEADPTPEPELTPQQYALLDAVRDVALSSADAQATKSAAEHLARMAGEAFGYPLPEPVQRQGGLADVIYGRPKDAEVERLRQLAHHRAGIIQSAVAAIEQEAGFGVSGRTEDGALTKAIQRIVAERDEAQGDLQTQIQITQDVRTERDRALAEAKKYKEAARKYQDEHAKECADVESLRAKLADAERALAEIRPIVEELDDDTVHDGTYAEILRSGIDRMKVAAERQLSEKRAATLDEAAQIVLREVALVWEHGQQPAVDQATEYAAESLRVVAREARTEAERG